MRGRAPSLVKLTRKPVGPLDASTCNTTLCCNENCLYVRLVPLHNCREAFNIPNKTGLNVDGHVSRAPPLAAHLFVIFFGLRENDLRIPILFSSCFERSLMAQRESRASEAVSNLLSPTDMKAVGSRRSLFGTGFLRRLFSSPNGRQQETNRCESVSRPEKLPGKIARSVILLLEYQCRGGKKNPVRSAAVTNQKEFTSYFHHHTKCTTCSSHKKKPKHFI